MPRDNPGAPRQVKVSERGGRFEPPSVAFFPDGARYDPRQPDQYTDPRLARMIYAGSSPKSGGKLLDGVEWCEFPVPADVAAVPA
jgi:hypothetical protein